MFDLARKKFKEELMIEIDDKVLERNLSPHSLRCAAYDTETDEIVSYFIWSITDTRFRDDLVAGRVTEEDLHLYNETYPPVLFFNTFIVTNSYHSPHIIHSLIQQLHELVKADQLNIVGGLSIGGLRFTEKWLKKYGFNEIGKYKGQYPILWATRDESAVLNSLCTPTKVYSHKPCDLGI